MLTKRVKSSYLFPNGNLAAFDIDGKQVSELQGQYSIVTHKRILLEALDNCEFEGFHILPGDFNRIAKEWSDYFRNKNMSYEEIKEL